MKNNHIFRTIVLVAVMAVLLTGCRSVPVSDDINDIPQFCGTGQMRVIFPESWNNKWHAEFPGDDMIRIYHDKSFEEWGGGHLCTFARFTDEIYKEYPAYEILKETDEAVYVIIYPSDVQFDPADEQSTQEYLDMFNSIDEVIQLFEIIED